MHFRPALGYLLLMPVAMLAACTAAIGPIVPTGEPGQYTLTSRSSGYTTSWVELKSQTLARARAYCESQGQKLTKPDVASNHATGLKLPVTYVTFNCEPIPQPKSAGQDQENSGEPAPAR
jgi:hypothetical protein